MDDGVCGCTEFLELLPLLLFELRGKKTSPFVFGCEQDGLGGGLGRVPDGDEEIWKKKKKIVISKLIFKKIKYKCNKVRSNCVYLSRLMLIDLKWCKTSSSSEMFLPKTPLRVGYIKYKAEPKTIVAADRDEIHWKYYK